MYNTKEKKVKRRNFYLTDEAFEMLKKLQKLYGHISKAETLRYIIRFMYETNKEKIK